MQDFLRKFAYTSCFILGMIFSLVTLSVAYVSYEIFVGTTVQALDSPDHTATLRRKFGVIDYKLVIDVDGRQVYNSGDIWGISETQLRATLIWDKTGRVVAYEQMGEIIFAYDAEEERRIGMNELKKYCLAPMPDNYSCIKE